MYSSGCCLTASLPLSSDKDKKGSLEAIQMAQVVKTPAVRADNQSWIPRMHMVDGDNRLPHKHTMVWTWVHTAARGNSNLVYSPLPSFSCEPWLHWGKRSQEKLSSTYQAVMVCTPNCSTGTNYGQDTWPQTQSEVCAFLLEDSHGKMGKHKDAEHREVDEYRYTGNRTENSPVSLYNLKHWCSDIHWVT